MKIDDPILTAYALGEPLSPEETAAVEALLAESAEARAFVEETQAFGVFLKEEFRTELGEALPEPRKVVPLPQPQKSYSPLWWSSAAVITAGLIAAGLMLPPLGSEVPLALKKTEAEEVTVASAPVELAAVTTSAPSSEGFIVSPEGTVEGTIHYGSPILSPADIAARAEQRVKELTEGENPALEDALTASSGNGGPADEILAPPVLAPSSSQDAETKNIRLTRGQATQIKQFTHGWMPKGSSGHGSNARITPFAGQDGNWDCIIVREAGVGDDIKGSSPEVAARDGRLARQNRSSDRVPAVTHERYRQLTENGFLDVSQQPLSTFSLDVDTASYANIRRMIERGHRPPPAAVRIEEMVNYFPYDDPAPVGGAPLGVRIESATAPWKAEHRLVRIGVKAKDIDRAAIKGVNLVFLIDTSGSMQAENKLPLVKHSLKLLLDQLGAEDRVAIVTYAGTSQTALPSTPVSERAKIIAIIDSLGAQGGTDGAGGLERAYQTAREGFIPDGVNRVILATDGDFNVGMTRDQELEAYIAKEAKSGVFLSILGFGIGNYNDQTMKLLSTKGSGNYAYIDTLDEARKVLGEQMRGTLVTVAKDVKLQVEFNPAKVQAYRLLGYENRLMAKEDFNNDQKDAGEVGAGHHVTALYEVIPVGVAPAVDPLKYQTSEEKPTPAASDSSEWLTVKLRYKAPDSEKSERLDFPFTDHGTALAESSTDLRFAAAVAQYAMLLSGSQHAGSTSWEEVITLAEGALGKDPHGYRAGFLRLAARASELANQQGTGWQ